MADIVKVAGHDDLWRVADTEFVQSFKSESTASRFCIRKPASLMSLYVELCAEFHGGRIVEIGIADGGSTALLALAAEPSLLVACELDATRRPALDALVESRGLSGAVQPFYGVDQADAARLAAIVDAALDGRALDLVIDDASHVYEPTVASFSVLFPRLRAGGLYIVEDWAADYAYAERVVDVIENADDARRAAVDQRIAEMLASGPAQPAPLPRLAVELALATAASPDAIASVSIDRHWLAARRGTAPLDRRGFSVTDLYSDYFGWFS